MADGTTLDEERALWLDDIDRLDSDIDVLERAMKDGSASLERGLHRMRELHDMRAEKFRGLGNCEARIADRARVQEDKRDQPDESKDRQSWKDRPETVSAARVPETSRNSELDWLTRQQGSPEAEPATAARVAQRPKDDDLDWLRKDIEANKEDVPQKERERGR